MLYVHPHKFQVGITATGLLLINSKQLKGLQQQFYHHEYFRLV